MNKKYFLAIIAITVCISWSQTINATEIITDLGTVEYDTYKYIDIPSSEDVEVDLEYVTSSINQSSLTMEHWSYDNITHLTKYRFTSELYHPRYWELDLDQEFFIYKDMATGDLFRVYIDMSNIIVPDDPWLLKFVNISNLYNETSTSLDETLTNLSDTKNELEELIILYTETCQELNLTVEQKNNLTDQLIAKSLEVNNLETDLNSTQNSYENALKNVTIFRRFYDEMTSYKSNFNFKLAGDN